MKFGFIGLGTMGRPMVRNLLKAGFEVVVFGRRRLIVDELVSEGAVAAGSSEEVAQVSDVVITMLPDSPDVKEVVTGENGILAGARPGLIVIDMSTISPKVTREIAEVASRRGVDYLDAPVTGGDTGAIAGTLSIMVGGKTEVFEKCLPILQAMGKNIVRIGEVGTGQTTKHCNQVI